MNIGPLLITMTIFRTNEARDLVRLHSRPDLAHLERNKLSHGVAEDDDNDVEMTDGPVAGQSGDLVKPRPIKPHFV